MAVLPKASFAVTVKVLLAPENTGLGKPPTVSVQDCARFVRLIDQAYEHAGFRFGPKGWAPA